MTARDVPIEQTAGCWGPKQSVSGSFARAISGAIYSAMASKCLECSMCHVKSLDVTIAVVVIGGDLFC